VALFAQEELQAAVPEAIQLLALDDDADDAADTGLFDKILADVENWIGGYLEQAGISLDSVLSNKRLKHLGMKYAEYSLWRRRGQGERSGKIYEEWIEPGMKWLARIATGAEALEVVLTAGAGATVVSEPARTFDAAGRLMT
jgi:hypothetical protein